MHQEVEPGLVEPQPPVGQLQVGDVDEGSEKAADKAVLVTADKPRNAEWVPKSQVEVHREFGTSLVMLDIPEWLAIDKGLV